MPNPGGATLDQGGDESSASAVMREWRRSQTAQAAPVAVTVPEVVTQANSTALAALWQTAQELANESLRAAQAAWETERAEADQDRAELEEVRAAADRATELHQEQQAARAQELAALRAELATATTRAERAEAATQSAVMGSRRAVWCMGLSRRCMRGGFRVLSAGWRLRQGGFQRQGGVVAFPGAVGQFVMHGDEQQRQPRLARSEAELALRVRAQVAVAHVFHVVQVFHAVLAIVLVVLGHHDACARHGLAVFQHLQR